jgi:hypothetical protein
MTGNSQPYAFSMKALLIALLTFVLPASGAEPFDFSLAEPVRIKEGDSLLNGEQDGGSVSIILEDSKKNLGVVHYTTKDGGPEHRGGQLSYRRSMNETSIRFSNGSDDEKRLLSILRAACLTTFGTSDPITLKNTTGERDAFSRMAMGKLLGHFPLKEK